MVQLECPIDNRNFGSMVCISGDEKNDLSMFKGCEYITDVTIQDALKLLGLNAIVAPQCSFERSLRKVTSAQYKRWQEVQLRIKEAGAKSLQAFPEDFIVENGRRYYRIQIAVDIDVNNEGFNDDETLETVGECLNTRKAIQGRRVVSSMPAPALDKKKVTGKKGSVKIPPAASAKKMAKSKKLKGLVALVSIVAVMM